MKWKTMKENNNKLLKRNEAAQFLGISEQTLATWFCKKKYDLPVIKIGGAVRYRLSDLEEFIERNTYKASK